MHNLKLGNIFRLYSLSFLKYYEDVVIIRVGNESAVVLPIFEYEPLCETIHLMISPVNALYFIASVARFETQKGTIQ